MINKRPKQVPFYIALTTCILTFATVYFLSSAIMTGIQNSVTLRTIEFLQSEIAFRDFVLNEKEADYTKDYVRKHFESNLSPVVLRHIAAKHWQYYIKINGATADTDILTVTDDSLVIEIIQIQTEPFLADKYHFEGSVTGGDKFDSLITHVRVSSDNAYTVHESTEIIHDTQTGDEAKITKFIYEFEPGTSLDESQNIIDLNYSPIFLGIGLTEGTFPSKIYFVNN